MHQNTAPTTVGDFLCPKVSLDIIEAMSESLRQGLTQFLTNPEGSVWLRIAIKRDGAGRAYFEFMDRKGTACGLLVRIAALSHWNLFVRRQFERLEGQLLGDEWCYRVPKDCHIIAATSLTPLYVTQGASL